MGGGGEEEMSEGGGGEGEKLGAGVDPVALGGDEEEVLVGPGPGGQGGGEEEVVVGRGVGEVEGHIGYWRGVVLGRGRGKECPNVCCHLQYSLHVRFT